MKKKGEKDNKNLFKETIAHRVFYHADIFTQQ
jgi:hypothetical protein